MPTPFPGMDPYLEDPALWPQFHEQFLNFLTQSLRQGLRQRYDVRVGERRYAVEREAGLCEEHRETYLEILDKGGVLVTYIDVVSPANKATATGRQAFLNTRKQARASRANLIEIDLVFDGPPLLEYSREGLPAWDYAVTVVRAQQPERYEIYTSTLKKRLPRFRLPLGADDRDEVMDLHIAMHRVYDLGGFGRLIDYGRAPPISLEEEDRRWLAGLFPGQGQVDSSSETSVEGQDQAVPTAEDIAVAAYFLWEQEGCPHGRDREHWQKALEQLRQPVEPG